MKIKSMGKKFTEFEYHDSEDGTLNQACALTYGGGLEIVSDDITYTISFDDVGQLVVRAAGRRFEHLNISPRSSNELRIWCEMWKPLQGVSD